MSHYLIAADVELQLCTIHHLVTNIAIYTPNPVQVIWLCYFCFILSSSSSQVFLKWP